MQAWLFLASAFVFVAFGGLMAAVDSALGATSRADVTELSFGSRARRSLLAIADDTGAHVNAVNFVRIIAETTAAVLVTLAFVSFLDNVWWVLLWSALIMTAVSFVLVGASPRSVGRAHAAVVLKLTAPVVHFLRVLLGPLANALVSLGNRVTPGRIRFAGVSSEEQLLSMVDEATELEVLEEGDRELIHSIFEFNDTVAREVMVPRTDMITIESTAHLPQAMALFLNAGYSRIPVIEQDADDVAGILYLRDLARLGFERPLDAADLTVGELARPAVFVPDSMKADALLRQMQLESNHLAMVVDEYGGIAGLVTLEDVIEELVGDISDEYDREAAQIEELGPGRFRVNARLPIDELGELFGLELDDEDVDSAGGLLAKELGRLAQPGEQAVVSGLVLRAERTEGRRKRISTILVERDQSLIDAQLAFESGDADGRKHRG
ncbi:hemolysin family protein [Agromyces sp. Leaf222]|uniref:hemolysin family protein n=1 Tax=Agromyces sp. Leaf222 TaxID=1735688 RepID=UPI0006F98E0C|nr:hemolysin family protein [Agromyces sp. Leaf222]KQM83691.1 hemolysin [Agromyces sp. Leaf222]